MPYAYEAVRAHPWIARFGRGVRQFTPRLTYALIAAVLLSLAALAARYYVTVKEELTDAVMARRAAVARLAASTLAERLDRSVELAASLATRVRFAELVAAGDWSAAVAILRRVPGAFPLVERLYLTDLNGTLLADAPELPRARGQSFAQRDWYRGLVQEWKPQVSAVFTADPGANVIAVATPVRDPHSGRVAGVLVLQLSPHAFFDEVRDVGLPRDAVLSVVDGSGRAAYRSGAEAKSASVDLSAHPAVHRLRQERAGAELAADPATGVLMVHASDPAKYGWGVIIEQPAAAAFAARERQLRFILGAFVLVLLLMAGAAWFGVRAGRQRQLERQLADLTRAQEVLATQAERLRIVHEIDRAIIAEARPEAIAGAVLQPLRALLGVPRVIVNMIDANSGEVEWLAAAGRHQLRVGPGVRFSSRLMGDLDALRRGEPQRIEVSALPPGPEVDALLASGVHFYLAVPMIAGDELIGALSFGGASPEFAADQVAIAQEVAAQLAIAIAHAGLLERVQRQAAELEDRVAQRTAALDAVNRELEDLYDNAPCGYHSVDAEGRIVRINQTWLDWLGLAREDVLGRMHPELMTPESAARFHTEAFPRFKREGRLVDVEFDYRRRDGSILHGSLSSTAVRDASGAYQTSRSIVFDIGARKAVERRLEAANKELGAFSYSVSHDLRAPLRAVDGYALMLQEDYGAKLDEEGRRLLAVVRSSAKQMGQLIDDLLTFAKLGRTEPAKRALDMNVLVGEVVSGIEGAERARIEVEALPAAQADRALLKQVWLNLVSNALKYSGKKQDARICIGGRREAGESLYWVRDNGVGFDMRYAAKLFGVFQRLHGAHDFPGTGVGLAIVQRVVSRHGGRVWAEAKPDEGACFYFSLPEAP